MTKLTTKQIKEYIAETIGRKEYDDLGEFCRLAGDYSFEEVKEASDWRRLKKFKLPDGRVVRYFCFAPDGLDEVGDMEPDARIITDATDSRIIDHSFGACRFPQEILFRVDDAKDLDIIECGYSVVVATIADYWKKEGCIDDQSWTSPYFPSGFEELMESTYEFQGTVEEARVILLEMGFIEEPRLPMGA